MNALDEDERANFELYTELLGMINSRANGNLNAATFNRYTEIYDALVASGFLEAVGYINQGNEKSTSS